MRGYRREAETYRFCRFHRFPTALGGAKTVEGLISRAIPVPRPPRKTAETGDKRRENGFTRLFRRRSTGGGARWPTTPPPSSKWRCCCSAPDDGLSQQHRHSHSGGGVVVRRQATPNLKPSRAS